MAMSKSTPSTDRKIVLRAAVAGEHDRRLAEPSARACSVSSAASLTSSLPVPRQAISAGEKFGQRQAAFGTSSQAAHSTTTPDHVRRTEPAARAKALASKIERLGLTC